MHGCRYEVDLGFNVDTLRLSSVEIEARTNRTADLVKVDRSWGTPYCASYGAGDFWFGTLAGTGPVVRAGAEKTSLNCSSSSKDEYFDGQRFTLDGIERTTSADTKLRLEWGEAGTQDEGWIWRSGRIFVRDTSALP